MLKYACLCAINNSTIVYNKLTRKFYETYFFIVTQFYFWIKVNNN